MDSDKQVRREEYESLVRQYSNSLYRYAMRLTGRHEIGEELVQETYLEAWKSLQNASVKYPQAYLFKILHRRYARWLDRQKHDSPLPQRKLDDQANEFAREDNDSLERTELVQVALNQLDEQLKQPVLLVLMEGITCEKAAAVLDIPKGTVLSRLHRGKQVLKTILSKLSEPGSNRVMQR